MTVLPGMAVSELFQALISLPEYIRSDQRKRIAYVPQAKGSGFALIACALTVRTASYCHYAGSSAVCVLNFCLQPMRAHFYTLSSRILRKYNAISMLISTMFRK
jgi:hypothetical protein